MFDLCILFGLLMIYCMYDKQTDQMSSSVKLKCIKTRIDSVITLWKKNGTGYDSTIKNVLGYLDFILEEKS